MTPSRRTGRRRLMYRLLLALAAAGLAAFFAFRTPTDVPPLRPEMSEAELVAMGQAVYTQHCASCHGANLEGQPHWKQRLPSGVFPAPPHDASGHTWHHPDQLLFRITKYGGQASAPRGFRSNMPGFKDKLSDTQIWAVLAYIKSRWPADVRAKQAEITQANQ